MQNITSFTRDGRVNGYVEMDNHEPKRIDSVAAIADLLWERRRKADVEVVLLPWGRKYGEADCYVSVYDRGFWACKPENRRALKAAGCEAQLCITFDGVVDGDRCYGGYGKPYFASRECIEGAVRRALQPGGAARLGTASRPLAE